MTLNLEIEMLGFDPALGYIEVFNGERSPPSDVDQIEDLDVGLQVGV